MHISNANEVHVWLVPVEIPAERQSSVELLPESERERARKFHFERDRLHYIEAHVALQTILSGYTGLTPGQITFHTTEKGKPYLDPENNPSQTFFNLSHSGDYALIAVGRGSEVGADIERHRSRIDYAQLSARFFTTAECRWLDSLPPEVRADGFFRLWSAKEALLKAWGTGLSTPLNRVNVKLQPQGKIAFESEIQVGLGRWVGCELQTVPDYSAAVVAHVADDSPELNVVRFDFGR